MATALRPNPQEGDVQVISATRKLKFIGGSWRPFMESFNTNGNMSFLNLSDVPATFPAAAHKHSKADISDFPSTMDPNAHQHRIADLKDFPTDLSRDGHTHHVGDIEDLNLNFAAPDHTHRVNQITDFPTDLSRVGHKHEMVQSMLWPGDFTVMQGRYPLHMHVDVTIKRAYLTIETASAVDVVVDLKLNGSQSLIPAGKQLKLLAGQNRSADVEIDAVFPKTGYLTADIVSGSGKNLRLTFVYE